LCYEVPKLARERGTAPLNTTPLSPCIKREIEGEDDVSGFGARKQVSLSLPSQTNLFNVKKQMTKGYI
jgi:hypothetical protein